MAGMPEESPGTAPVQSDLISDDDRSVAADSWSIKSEYGSTLDDNQRHVDASDALNFRSASAFDYGSDKEEADAGGISSELGFQSYWDAAYADELSNFREHGHAGLELMSCMWLLPGREASALKYPEATYQLTIILENNPLKTGKST